MISKADFLKLASELWGASDPVAEIRKIESILRKAMNESDALIAGDLSDIRTALAYLPGIIDDPQDDTRSQVLLDTGMDVSILEGSYLLDGRGKYALGDIATVPRPGDGVIREPLGTVLGDPLEETILSTGGEIQSSPPPIIEARNIGFNTFVTLVEGLDYDINYPEGDITILETAPNVAEGDTILFTGSWVGSWTCAAVYDKNGQSLILRGQTGSFDRTTLEDGINIFDFVQVAAIGPIDDSILEITSEMIQNDRCQYFGTAAIAKIVDPVNGHRHRGYAGDAPPVVNVVQLECAEDIPVFKAAAINSTAQAVMFSHTNPARWEYIGVSLKSYLAGQIGTFQKIGEMTNPAWSFDPTKPIWAYANGDMTQTSPEATSEIAVVIGYVIDPTRIYLIPQLTIEL